MEICKGWAIALSNVQPVPEVEPIPVPKQRFFHLNVDLVWPLLTSKKVFQYLFTAVDRTSCWCPCSASSKHGICHLSRRLHQQLGGQDWCASSPDINPGVKIHLHQRWSLDFEM